MGDLSGLRIALCGGRRHGTAVLDRLIGLGVKVPAVFSYAPTPSEAEVERPLARVCADVAIPYHELPDLRRKAAKAALREARPDALLCVKWRTLLDEEALDIAPRGCFVVHDSLLPKLRGAAPMNWALILGERETGATLFKAELGLDCGPIAAQLTTPIGEDDTAHELETRLVSIYADLAERLARGLAAGDLPLVPQDESLATYGTWRLPADGQIDWTRRARQVHDLVRAVAPPFPGAPTTIDLKPVLVTRTRVVQDVDRWVGRVVGRVVRVEKGRGVHVLCGEGTVRVEELVVDGKTVAADEAVRSVKATFGR